MPNTFTYEISIFFLFKSCFNKICCIYTSHKKNKIGLTLYSLKLFESLIIISLCSLNASSFPVGKREKAFILFDFFRTWNGFCPEYIKAKTKIKAVQMMVVGSSK